MIPRVSRLSCFANLLLALFLCAGCQRHYIEPGPPPGDPRPSTIIPLPHDVPGWNWTEQHNDLKKVSKENGKNIKLLFLGDSITNLMDEPTVGRPAMEARWKKYGVQAFGIGGDMTQHLLYRIQHGEVDGLDPKVVVVHIGTNNLNNNSDEDIFTGVKANVDELRKRLPNSKIIVVGLLPRASEPDSIYRHRVNGVNALLKTGIADGDHVQYVDIGGEFVTGDGKIIEELMPDWLHPSAKGYEVFFDAIKPTVDKALAS